MSEKTLLQRISDAKELGMQFSKNNKLKQSKGEMDAMKPHLEASEKCFRNIEYIHNSLTNIGVSSSWDASEVKEKLLHIKKQLESGKFDPSGAEFLESLLKQIEKAQRTEWKHFVDSKIADARTISDSVKEIVNDHPDYVAMKSALSRINTYEVGNEAVLTSIEDYMTHYKSLMSDLNFSEEVSSAIEILTKSGGIQINDISKECFLALKNSKFSNKLRIVIGR